MSTQHSFTKLEKPLYQELKNSLMQAESTEDAKKFFSRTVCRLIASATRNAVEPDEEEVTLDPEADEGYRLGEELLADPSFRSVWKDSDLKRIVRRMAETAAHRYHHLEKNPEKTESKIFPGPGESR
jgi:hypothetical protein